MLVVQNVSGGDNSHVAGALTFLDASANPIGDQSEDFDQGEVAVVGNSFVDNNMSRAAATPREPATAVTASRSQTRCAEHRS